MSDRTPELHQSRSGAATQLATFELEVVVVDHPTDRRRRNGDPMASRDADEALRHAVDAFRAVLRAAGFAIARTGYGVTAQEVEADA